MISDVDKLGVGTSTLKSYKLLIFKNESPKKREKAAPAPTRTFRPQIQQFESLKSCVYDDYTDLLQQNIDRAGRTSPCENGGNSDLKESECNHQG